MPSGADAPPPAASPAPAYSPPTASLLPPEPIRRDSERKSTESTDQSKEPPVANVPEKSAPKTEEDRETPKPIDIPGYAIAFPNVASGLHPSLTASTG